MGIQLRELVALEVWSDVEGRGCVLATDDKGTLDDGIVGFAVDGGGAEDVFAGGFETGKEAT